MKNDLSCFNNRDLLIREVSNSFNNRSNIIYLLKLHSLVSNLSQNSRHKLQLKYNNLMFLNGKSFTQHMKRTAMISFLQAMFLQLTARQNLSISYFQFITNATRQHRTVANVLRIKTKETPLCGMIARSNKESLLRCESYFGTIITVGFLIVKSLKPYMVTLFTCDQFVSKW